jgi:hypothetical protein
MLENGWVQMRHSHSRNDYLMSMSPLVYSVKVGTVAEWLRRSTRNRLDLFRIGSSPVGVVSFPFANFCRTQLQLLFLAAAACTLKRTTGRIEFSLPCVQVLRHETIMKIQLAAECCLI